MPELPEVETIIRNLRPLLIGHYFRNSDQNEYTKISGLKVLDIKRRGKFINIFLEKDFVLTIHLRMTGRLIVRGLKDEALRFERVKLDFENLSLRFCDQRKFGKIWLNKTANYEEKTGIIKLGADPTENAFDFGNFQKLLAKRRGNVKAFLLNQSLVSGIGNIYADESLFLAGIRPHRKIENLRAGEKQKLFRGIKLSLQKGIENSGTSFSDFVNAHGQKGKNQEKLNVYHRAGEKCLECENILTKTKVAGRGTVYCQKCQK